MKNLITPAMIVEATVISLSTEPGKLRKAIPLAQGKHLRPLLGWVLFDALLDFAATGPDEPLGTDAPALEAYRQAREAWILAMAATQPRMLLLLKQVESMLCAWSVVEAWPALLGHVTTAGVVLKTGKSEGTTTADEKTETKIFIGLQNTAIYYTEELSRWLLANRSNYALFMPQAPQQTGRLPIGGICFLD